jgi:HSP20 family molecular chaperone IbpA
MADYFEDDEVFRDIDSFYKRMMKHMFKEMENFEKAVRSGKLKGTWDVKPINKPGVRGYVARGQFQLGGEPMRVPRRALEEKREPLTDVFDEKKNVNIYMELPGVDKNDIQLDVTDGFVEVKAKTFAKTVELPTRNVAFTKATANYKNGVLQVTIPRIKKTVKDGKKRSIKIE